MGDCSLQRLGQLLDKKLNLNARIEAYDHLDKCRDCREAIYFISHDRDRALFVYRKQTMRLSVA